MSNLYRFGPGFFSGIRQNIKKTLASKESSEYFVGTDIEGNKYFEKPADPERGTRALRRVQTITDDQWTPPRVPAEWMTWLQGRRNKPPSEQEIDRNYLMMVRTQKRAEDLDKQHQLEQEENPVEKTIRPSTAKKEFPKYEEYENLAGAIEEKNNR